MNILQREVREALERHQRFILLRLDEELRERSRRMTWEKATSPASSTNRRRLNPYLSAN